MKFKDKSIHVFAIVAITNDGFIAPAEDLKKVSTDWTSEEDKEWFWDRTAKAGAIVMGSTTFWATGKSGWPLPGRMNYVLTRDPKAIWDKYESDEERAKIKEKTNLQFLNAVPKEVIKQAVQDGFSELAVCGGTKVYTDFLPLLETIYLTRETSVNFDDGLPLFTSFNLEKLNNMLEEEFVLISQKQVNSRGTVFEEWKRK